MIELPPLPASVPFAIGPITVSDLPLDASDPDMTGRVRWPDRAIEIFQAMHPAAQWVTLWHEIVHAILIDAGIHGNTITAKQEEAVCDAVANYLTARMRDGSLTVTF